MSSRRALALAAANLAVLAGLLALLEFYLNLAAGYQAGVDRLASERGVPVITHRLSLRRDKPKDLFLDMLHKPQRATPHSPTTSRRVCASCACCRDGWGPGGDPWKQRPRRFGSFRICGAAKLDAGLFRDPDGNKLTRSFSGWLVAAHGVEAEVVPGAEQEEAPAMSRFRIVGGLVREFLLFMKEDRTWWLAPILVALLGLGAFIIFAQGSALAPFIYALF